MCDVELQARAEAGAEAGLLLGARVVVRRPRERTGSYFVRVFSGCSMRVCCCLAGLLCAARGVDDERDECPGRRTGVACAGARR